MNTAIQAALEHAVQNLQAEGVLPADWNNSSNLTRTKDRSHGDFASNIAMIASKAAGMKPRDLAEKILAALPEVADISNCLLYTSPSPRDQRGSRMPSSA